MLTLPAVIAQINTQEQYFPVNKAKLWEIKVNENGSFDLRFDSKFYSFDWGGTLTDSSELPRTPLFSKLHSGCINATDETNGICYSLAPENIITEWVYGRILVQDPDGTEEMIEYDDPDAPFFNRRDFIHGSSGYQIMPDGRVLFFEANGGTSAMGPERIKGRFNNYVKIYVFDPARKTVNLSVGLANKIPVAPTRAAKEGYDENDIHGEILGVMGNQLIVAYNYTEGIKTGKRTVDIWSMDLTTLEEKQLTSQTVPIVSRLGMQYSAYMDGAGENTGYVYAVSNTQKQNNGVGGVYSIFHVTADLEVHRYDMVLPAEAVLPETRYINLKLGDIWFPPMLDFYTTPGKLFVYGTIKDKILHKESLAIFECDESEGTVEYRLVEDTKWFYRNAERLFMDEGNEELIRIYREEKEFENRENICKKCEVRKAAHYFVDAGGMKHLLIIELLYEDNICTDCPANAVYARVRTVMSPD